MKLDPSLPPPDLYQPVDPPEGNGESEGFLLFVPSVFLSPNWRTNVVVRSAFETEIELSGTGDEYRRSLRESPNLDFRFNVTSTEAGAMGRILNVFKDAQRALTVLPLWCDAVECDAFPAATQVITPCLANRFGYSRFVQEPFTYFLLFDDDSKYGSKHSVETLATLESHQITLNAPTVEGYSRPKIVPLVPIQPNLTQKGKYITADYGEFTVAAEGLPEAEGRFLGGEELESHQHFDTLDILPARWYDYGKSTSVAQDRTGRSSEAHLMDVFSLYGTLSRFRPFIRFVGLDRQQAAEFLHFFNDHRGRLSPFWAASPLNEFKEVSIDSVLNQVTLTFTGLASTEAAGVTHLAFIVGEDTFVHEVSEVSQADNTATYDVLCPQFDLSTVGQCPDYVKRARLCRFYYDQVQENWKTTEIVTLTTAIVEIDKERWVTSGIQTLPDVTDPVAGDFVVWQVVPCAGGDPIFYILGDESANENKGFLVQGQPATEPYTLSQVNPINITPDFVELLALQAENPSYVTGIAPVVPAVQTLAEILVPGSLADGCPIKLTDCVTSAVTVPALPQQDVIDQTNKTIILAEFENPQFVEANDVFGVYADTLTIYGTNDAMCPVDFFAQAATLSIEVDNNLNYIPEAVLESAVLSIEVEDNT